MSLAPTTKRKNITLLVREIDSAGSAVFNPELETVIYSIVDRSSADTLTNKDLTDASNRIVATGIRSDTGGNIAIIGGAPTAGQVLTATGPTAAQWQVVSGGGGGGTIGTPAVATPTVAPTAGQILTATSTATSTWQTYVPPSAAQIGTPAVTTPAAAPAAGNVLTASSVSTSTWQPPAPARQIGAGPAIVNTPQTFAPTNGLLLTSIGGGSTEWLSPAPASAIATSGAPVVLPSTSPAAGQILTATSSTAATWQTPPTATSFVATAGPSSLQAGIPVSMRDDGTIVAGVSFGETFSHQTGSQFMLLSDTFAVKIESFNGNLSYQAYTVSGTNLTSVFTTGFGTPHRADNIKLVRISANECAIVYVERLTGNLIAYYILYTGTSTNIGQITLTTFSLAAITPDMFDASMNTSGQLVVVYRDPAGNNFLTGTVATMGTSPVKGPNVVIANNFAISSTRLYPVIVAPLSAGRMAVMYLTDNPSYQTYCIPFTCTLTGVNATITPGVVFTFFTTNLFSSPTCQACAISQVSADVVLVAGRVRNSSNVPSCGFGVIQFTTSATAAASQSVLSINEYLPIAVGSNASINPTATSIVQINPTRSVVTFAVGDQQGLLVSYIANFISANTISPMLTSDSYTTYTNSSRSVSQSYSATSTAIWGNYSSAEYGYVKPYLFGGTAATVDKLLSSGLNIVGVTTTSAAAGGSISVATSGVVNMSIFGPLLPGRIYYANSGSLLLVKRASSTGSIVIGKAITSSLMRLMIE
jgi:hypothetical protein